MTKIKNVMRFIFCVLLLTSCEINKTYKYVEEVNEIGILGGSSTKTKDPENIKAPNDSVAYFQAYQRFCISQKVYKDVAEAMNTSFTTPTKFYLYNESGEDIAISFYVINKEEREQEIYNDIFSAPNSVKQSMEESKKEEAENFKKTVKIDSQKINELKVFFRIKQDEFSNEEKITYTPKSAPIYINDNGLYCYFQTENGMPSNLRFIFQYYADEWLFFNKILFSIDGKAFEFIPDDTETDNGDGGYIWEWFDEQVKPEDKELINALANAKSAKMRIVGRQYRKERVVTNSQILGIRRTIELYKVMGGQY